MLVYKVQEGRKMNPQQSIDDRYRRAILSNITHPRLSGRSLELVSELVQMLATGSIRCGDFERIVHRAKIEDLETATELARQQVKTIQKKRASRSKSHEERKTMSPTTSQ